MPPTFKLQSRLKVLEQVERKHCTNRMNLQISKEKRREKFGFFFISRQISVQKFRSILIGKPCGLLTWC